MYCSKCHHPLQHDARFCGVCGQAIEAAAAARVSPAVTVAIPVGPSAADAAATAAIPKNYAPWSFARTMERIKNILLSPKTEWQRIAVEPTSAVQLYVGYVLPLTAWAALITLIHLSLLGARLPFGNLVRTPLADGLAMAGWTFVCGFIGMFLISLIVNALAPTFGGARDQNQALKVAVYSLTPAYVGSVLALSPVMPSLLQFLILCFGLYVLYLGLPVVMRSPRERALGYTITVVLCTFVLGVIVGLCAGALGIFSHSAGLLGSNAAEQAAAQEQGAATVGNVIGSALGSNEQGKAGLTTALSNLVKAGQQQSASGATTAANATPPTAAAAADSTQNAGAAIGNLIGALGGAMGGEHPKQAVDFNSLTPLLPAELSGMKRTAAQGESQGAMGVRTSTATGTYQNGSGTVHVEITDLTAVSGVMGIAGALVQSTTSQSDSGFEKDSTIAGRPVHEKYDVPSKHGELTAMIAQRFQVEVSGEGVDMGTLEQAFGQIDVSKLESMKNQGAAQ